MKFYPEYFIFEPLHINCFVLVLSDGLLALSFEGTAGNSDCWNPLLLQS